MFDAFDTPVQDAIDDTASVSDLINDFLDSDLTAPAPVDVSQPWAPPVWDGMPDVSYPYPVQVTELIHPEEFALNGFPYQGQDPTEPGYWSLPSF